MTPLENLLAQRLAIKDAEIAYLVEVMRPFAIAAKCIDEAYPGKYADNVVHGSYAVPTMKEFRAARAVYETASTDDRFHSTQYWAKAALAGEQRVAELEARVKDLESELEAANHSLEFAQSPDNDFRYRIS